MSFPTWSEPVQAREGYSASTPAQRTLGLSKQTRRNVGPNLPYRQSEECWRRANRACCITHGDKKRVRLRGEVTPETDLDHEVHFNRQERPMSRDRGRKVGLRRVH